MRRGAFFISVDRITDSLLLGGVAWYLASANGAHAAICRSLSSRCRPDLYGVRRPIARVRRRRHIIERRADHPPVLRPAVRLTPRPDPLIMLVLTTVGDSAVREGVAPGER
jgi:hypothetical protein